MALLGAASLHMARHHHRHPELQCRVRDFRTWPTKLKCRVQPFLSGSSGLKCQVQGLCMWYPRRKCNQGKHKGDKRIRFFLIPRFYLYFLGIVNGLCQWQLLSCSFRSLSLGEVNHHPHKDAQAALCRGTLAGELRPSSNLSTM